MMHNEMIRMVHKLLFTLFDQIQLIYKPWPKVYELNNII